MKFLGTVNGALEMSGAICKLIGPVKAQLLRYLKDTETFLSAPISDEEVEEEKITADKLINYFPLIFLF